MFIDGGVRRRGEDRVYLVVVDDGDTVKKVSALCEAPCRICMRDLLAREAHRADLRSRATYRVSLDAMVKYFARRNDGDKARAFETAKNLFAKDSPTMVGAAVWQQERAESRTSVRGGGGGNRKR